MKRNKIIEEIRSTEEYYIQAVKDNLTCNNDVFCGYYTFDYSGEQVYNNAKYFVDCMKRGLSPIKHFFSFMIIYKKIKPINNCRLK